jgi:hypothetical protein
MHSDEDIGRLALDAHKAMVRMMVNIGENLATIVKVATLAHEAAHESEGDMSPEVIERATRAMLATVSNVCPKCETEAEGERLANENPET